MELLVDLVMSAEDNPLAVLLAERVRANLRQRRSAEADFRALRGTVLVVAHDTAQTVSLRFDHGRLTIHDGNVGVPSVTFCGEERDLLELCRLPWLPLLGLPLPLPSDEDGRARVIRLWGGLRSGQLKIYGLTTHARLVSRVLRLWAEPPA